MKAAIYTTLLLALATLISAFLGFILVIGAMKIFMFVKRMF